MAIGGFLRAMHVAGLLNLILCVPLLGAGELCPKHVIFPYYPSTCQVDGLQGEVKLRIVANKYGNVSSVNIIRGAKGFDESVVRAANDWKFAGPGRKVVTFRFILIPLSEWKDRKGSVQFDLPDMITIFEPKVELPSDDHSK